MTYEVSKKIKTFKDLRAWEYSHNLVLQIYRLSKKFPDDERFGLTNQMRRAAVSVSSNIAEGFSRRSGKDKQNFYRISHGSAAEVLSQITIAKDLQYITDSEYQEVESLIFDAQKLISGLIKAINDGKGQYE